MIILENDSRKRRFGIKIKEKCSSKSCTDSRRTSGVVKSPTVRNRTSVICVKRCGYLREGSPQSQFFQFRLLSIFSTPVKLFQRSTRWYTDVGVSYTEFSRRPLPDALFVLIMKKASVQSGLNCLKNSQRYSITVWKVCSTQRLLHTVIEYPLLWNVVRDSEM